MCAKMWAFRRQQQPEPGTKPLIIPNPVDEKIAAFREARRRGLIPHTRSASKKSKDLAHNFLHQERLRLFTEAFWDHVDSKGEVDALTPSESLGVSRGDVLFDIKIHGGVRRGYTHPGLRDFFYIRKEEVHELAAILRARDARNKDREKEQSQEAEPVESDGSEAAAGQQKQP